MSPLYEISRRLGLTPFVEYLLSKVVAEHRDN